MSKVALITGATGFIGPRLVDRLLSDEWQVHVLGRSDTVLDRLGTNASKVTFHVDPGDAVELTQLVSSIKPLTCFHLATKFLAAHATDDLEDLLQSNIAFGARLAEACAKTGGVRFINAGTLWQHHSSRSYGPVSLYAATKQALLDLLQYYAERENLSVVHLVCSDNYGPDDPRAKLMQYLIGAAKNNEPLAMTAGEQYIDAVYVDDAVEGFVRASEIEVAQPFEKYSITSGAPVTIREFVSLFEEVTDTHPPISWGERPYRPIEMMEPWQAAPPLPGWAPEISLREGMKRVWESVQ